MHQLDQLATAWAVAKQREEEARLERVEIENKILAIHPAKEEGSDTVATPTGTKIRLTGKLTYKANVEALQSLTAGWPEALRPIKTEIKADESALKILRSERQDLWRQIAPAVETKAAKVGVTITFPGQEV
jgi:SMC interacting uncharacterized protein involved in chromosome segregation